MQVTVGNPTQVHRQFQYRYPGQKTIRVIPINAGAQEVLPDDLVGAALENVIAQIQRCGGVPEDDIRAIILPKQLVYKVSPKPIDVETLQEGMALDEEARQEVSGAKLEEAGFAAFKTAQDEAAKIAKHTGRHATVIETRMEIVETTDRGAVKDGVNTEFVVSAKPERRAGKKRTEDKH